MRNRRILLLFAVAWPLAGLWVLALEVAVRKLIDAPLPQGHVQWQFIGWCEWILLAPLVVLLTMRFPWKPRARLPFFLVHTIAPFVVSAIHSLAYFGLRIFFRGAAGEPGLSLGEVWLARLQAHLTLDFLVYGATVLATHIILFFRAAWSRERERMALERSIAQTELDIFKLQLQPEIVGEKLQALEALIERDPAAAETLLSRFSALLRQSLAASDARRPLADEIAYANALVAVERLLDGSTPELTVDLSADAAQALVPGACLTPIVHALLRAQQRAGEDGEMRVGATADGALRLTIETPFDTSRDPELRHLVREIAARLGDGERLLHEPHAIVYEGPLVTSAPVEDETPLVHEDDAQPVAVPRLSLPLRFLIVIGAVPVVLLVINAFRVLSEVSRGRAVSWGIIGRSFEYSWLAWPVTLLMLVLGARLPLGERTWKRNVFLLAVAAAAVPPLWDLGFQMLRYTITQHESAWRGTRAFLLSSSRTLDFLVFFGIALSALAYQRYVAWRQRAVEIGDLDARLLRTRARLLRLQLNPHFLFNALNSIAALLEDDPAAARRMAARLRHFVDRVLKTSDRQEVPLGEELDLLTTYVAIENVRFGDRLELDLLIDEVTLDAFVPSLLLQPLVENAVRHGLQPSTGGRVSVSARRSVDGLRLEVLDNGHTARSAVLREGIGLTNTRSRLRQLYGDHYTLEVDRREDGFRATLTIPFRTAA
ncbi:MAG TPA: histidine kinase [Thermoanaerobaculia bacterium]|jgi:sensor histidine kinase YesM